MTQEININWKHEADLTGRDREIHQSLDGDGMVARSENNYSVFVFVQINGTYGCRGGYRSHANLSWREEYPTREGAMAGAEAWLIRKEQERIKRSILASARLG